MNRNRILVRRLCSRGDEILLGFEPHDLQGEVAGLFLIGRDVVCLGRNFTCEISSLSCQTIHGVLGGIK